MRILLTLPHFYQPSSQPRYGSQRSKPESRIEALALSLLSVQQLFGSQQYHLNIAKRQVEPANQGLQGTIDVVICTTGEAHLLSQVPDCARIFEHQPTQSEPMLLGFECQAVLRDRLGQYDYYGYLEDDLILRDPYFFQKLNWFNQQTRVEQLLLPHRFELSHQHPAVRKLYVDGDLRKAVTAQFQNVDQDSIIQGAFLQKPIQFVRPLNPHSGCYFLSQAQLETWVAQSHFLDRDTSFIGPLESAATLGLLKTFQIYKPAPAMAAFLEIQHYGQAFVSLVGGEVALPAATEVSG